MGLEPIIECSIGSFMIVFGIFFSVLKLGPVEQTDAPSNDENDAGKIVWRFMHNVNDNINDDNINDDNINDGINKLPDSTNLAIE